MKSETTHPHQATYEELKRLDKWIMSNTDHLPDDFAVMPLNHGLITSILTKERIRIVNHVREHGPVESLQDLAQALGRDRSAVSRDIVLMEGRLIEVEKRRRQKTIRAVARPVIIY